MTGAELAAWMERHDWRNGELAERLGIHPQTIMKYKLREQIPVPVEVALGAIMSQDSAKDRERRRAGRKRPTRRLSARAYA